MYMYVIIPGGTYVYRLCCVDLDLHVHVGETPALPATHPWRPKERERKNTLIVFSRHCS